MTLEQVLPPDLSFVYLAKVDTEGAELSVLHAMMPFISKRKVSLQCTHAADGDVVAADAAATSALSKRGSLAGPQRHLRGHAYVVRRSIQACCCYRLSPCRFFRWDRNYAPETKYQISLEFAELVKSHGFTCQQAWVLGSGQHFRCF